MKVWRGAADRRNENGPPWKSPVGPSTAHVSAAICEVEAEPPNFGIVLLERYRPLLMKSEFCQSLR